MIVRKLAAGVAALALVAGPAVAQVAMAPSFAPLSGDESSLEDGETILVGALGAAAIIGGIIAASSDNKADIPVSG